MNEQEPQKLDIEELGRALDFLRLSRGITRARARELLLSGEKLEPGWESKLKELRAQAVKNTEAVKKAETFDPKQQPKK